MNVFGHILEFLLEEVFGTFFWLVLQVIGRVLATPFILILSCFGPGRYGQKVADRYRNWFAWTWRIKPD